MQNIILNVNGELKNPLDPVIPAFDRSFLYGDSLYEVARTYKGRFFALEDHLLRLAKSAELCHMKLSQPLSLYKKECEQSLSAFYAIKANKNKDAYCRLIVSRGTGKIGFGTDNLLTDTQFFIIVQPLPALTEADFEKGAHYKIVKRLRNDKRALDPAMKSGNYLNSLLAFLEAKQPGSPHSSAEDALMLDSQGFMTEGTTFNIFYVNRGIVATSPLDIGILDGITRRHTLRIAKKLGIETREVRYKPEYMLQADEVFMTSTTKEIFPVTKIDNKKIANGKPGKITRLLAQHLHQDIMRRLSL